MKKLWIMLLLAATGTTMAYAQTEQGNMVISGSIGGSFSSNKIEDIDFPGGFTSKSTGIRIRPSFGYFIQEGLEVGLSTLIYFSKSNDMNGGAEHVYHNRSFGFAPYVRKYFVLSDKLMAHGTGSISADFNSNWVERPSDKNLEKNKSTSLGVFLYPGITYFVTEKLGITATLGQLGYKRDIPKKGEGRVVNQNIIADVSLNSLTLGINYFITR
ncbi:outer membrane beta-barrel protein [Pontibacter sp. 13R65]|uniref:outer membrane beta-barrel protein n=1 Tax=Pontibacter sp. 13R65 TaxID=3127458 RepID=UPI00301C155B